MTIIIECRCDICGTRKETGRIFDRRSVEDLTRFKDLPDKWREVSMDLPPTRIWKDVCPSCTAAFQNGRTALEVYLENNVKFGEPVPVTEPTIINLDRRE